MAEENRWKREEEEEEEEEEEIDEAAYKSAKDAVIFAIEVSPSMLASPPMRNDKKGNNDSPASAALKCAYHLMQQRIISNPNDMMGILLYGTEQSKFQTDDYSSSGLAYPHCYLLADLDIPIAADIKVLKALVEDEDEFKKLFVPSEKPVSIGHVLFCANQIFTTKAPNFSSRRLFIVTNEDEPHANDKVLKINAATRAKDLYDLGVIIELFPISKPGKQFNRTKFYDDIIYNSSPTDLEAPAPLSQPTKTVNSGDGISPLNSLLSSINSKAVAKRALFSLPFEIGPGLKISVKGYIIFKRQLPRRSCYVWIGGETPQIAKGVSTQISDEDARAVEKPEIKKAYKFGGEQISFTLDEMASIRNFGDPVIRIIGFKPLALLPFWANLKPATFLYPSEDDYVGSTRVFSALQQKLLKDQKMGIAWFVARRNAAPVIAAILPGAERLDDEGNQLIPPGMWIIPLPYADDIRQNPETMMIRSPDNLTNMMRNVIQQLQLPKAQYFPEKYPNPALQWHYRILQALALDEELPEKPEDKTIPKYKQIDKRAGPYVIEWGVELEEQSTLWAQNNRSGSTTTLTKRKASSPANARGEEQSTSSKKAKAGGDPPATATATVPVTVTDADMAGFFEQNTISKLTLADLKGWMRIKGLPATGKKADLVERIETYLERK